MLPSMPGMDHGQQRRTSQETLSPDSPDNSPRDFEPDAQFTLGLDVSHDNPSNLPCNPPYSPLRHPQTSDKQYTILTNYTVPQQP